MLSGRLPEATLVRLDTDATSFLLYVAGHALLGLAVAWPVHLTVRDRLPAPARATLIAAVLFALDLFAFQRLWAHRGLPIAPGATLLAAGAAIGAVVATLGSLGVARLPARGARVLAIGLPAALLVVTAGTLLATAFGSRAPAGITLDEPVRQPTGVKVAILALDGLDGRLVDEAIGAGRMPNVAALSARGVRGDLRSIRPPKSPVVWTSAVTGVLPGVHGIRDFVVLREGERVPVTSNLRKAPALWNLAEPLDFTCAFVNWYVTWPAEPTRGVIVSDRVDLGGLDHRVFPEDRTATVDSVRAAVNGKADRDIARFTDSTGDFEEWRAGRWGQVRRSLRILDDVVRHDLVTLETARAVTADDQPDLCAFYFRGNDNTQHLFWKYRLADRGADVAETLFRELDPADVAALSHVVDRYYDFIDDLVGECVAMLGPDTAILVLSDHGFLTNNERNRWFHGNRLLEAGGFATLAPDGGGAADTAASVVCDPVPPSVDARRLLRAGGASGNAEEDLRRAKSFLDGLATDAGEPLFVSTALGRDEQGPRLAVVFARNLEGESVRIGGDEVPLTEFSVPEGHSGDHRMNGFLCVAGGPFRSGETYEGARVTDVAPTVLHLLGAPVGRDMEGVALTGLLRDDWNSAHPVTYVESYGLLEPTEGDAIATDADEKIREELRALGYLQ